MNRTTSQVPHVCATCKKNIRAGERHWLNNETRERYHELALCAPAQTSTGNTKRVTAKAG